MAKGTKTPAERRIRMVPRELVDHGRQMAGAGRDVWLAGLGVLAVAGQEGTELFDRLVKSGEEFEKRGKAQAGERRKELSAALEEQVYEPVLSAVRRITPTRVDMQDLSARVDQVARRVEALVARLTREGEAAEPRTLKVYRVIADPRGWAVARDGEKTAVAVRPTKEEALDQARTLARTDVPSRLDVYRKNGSLQESHDF